MEVRVLTAIVWAMLVNRAFVFFKHRAGLFAEYDGIGVFLGGSAQKLILGASEALCQPRDIIRSHKRIDFAAAISAGRAVDFGRDLLVDLQCLPINVVWVDLTLQIGPKIPVIGPVGFSQGCDDFEVCLNNVVIFTLAHQIPDLQLDIGVCASKLAGLKQNQGAGFFHENALTP